MFLTNRRFIAICYALASFRFTHLLWWENGPLDIFDWLRAKVGVEAWAEEDGLGSYTYKRSGNTFLAKVFNCPHCLGSYVSFIAVLCFLARKKVLDILALWGAFWGLSLILFGFQRSDQ